MALSVRDKIKLGTLFLFVLLLVAGGAGIYFTAKLRQDAQTVLRNNYESIAYCHIIQQQLDSLENNRRQRITRIAGALQLQESNITEQGEGGATQGLRRLFEKLQQGDTTKGNTALMQQELQRILKLNMEAIYTKNSKAEKTSTDAMAIIIGIAGLVFLIAFTFSLNFPSIVTRPISELAEAISEISNRNYQHRIHLPNKDEFGQLADAFNQMAARLEYFENSNLNKILFEKSRAEAVINSLRDASIGIDCNHVVLFANHEALQLLGLKAGDIVGKPAAEVAQRNDLFRYLIGDDSTVPFKIVVDNRENYFVKEIIDVAQGDANSRVMVLKNITTFKELDAAKTNFIATISHELKTPLAASDFSLRLLEDTRTGSLSDAQRELIQSLRQDNQRVLRIISELLNMSQAETGKIQLDICLVAPALIIDSAVETVTSAARERNITIKKNIAPDMPAIHADPEKTTWVLNNFLTNAIKYAYPYSEVTISTDQSGDRIVFAVKDQGPGIAREYMPRLFERYFQVPGSKTRGTGLGLSISKDFIEAQQGSIWAESEPGKGSGFYFSLPLNTVKM